MNTSTLLIITGILNAPAIVALVNKLLTRSKDRIDGEVTIGGEWQKYALQAKTDKKEMERQFDIVLKEMDTLKDQIIVKNEKIRTLEERVQILEKELERYHQMEKKVDELKETAHQAVDVVGDQLKQVINPPK